MKQIIYLIIVCTCFNCTTAEIPLIQELDSDITITYTTNIQPIIFNNCLTCHSNINPSGGLVLTNYQQVKNAAEKGNLITRMNSNTNPMPPNGKLVQASLNIINNWKENGFIEK